MKKFFRIEGNAKEYRLSNIESNLPGIKLFWLKTAAGHVCNILQKPSNQQNDQITLDCSEEDYQKIFFGKFLYGIYPKTSNPLDAMAVEKAICLLNSEGDE